MVYVPWNQTKLNQVLVATRILKAYVHTYISYRLLNVKIKYSISVQERFLLIRESVDTETMELGDYQFLGYIIIRPAGF